MLDLLKKTKLSNTTLRNHISIFLKGIWLFPTILTLGLIVLSLLQLSGSSMGQYHIIFYGSQSDPDLVANHPETIRSDEWVVNTQKAIAQKNNNFNSINNNIGDGEDATLLADTPTNDWSTIFKPHNIGFLALPFDIAFSLRWWMLSYLLVLSCYFFIVTMLPKKRLLASILSLGFLFSPFFQWWYAYGTLGSVYYSLFGAVVFIKLLQTKNKLHAWLWGLLLAYIAICFVLILYPPFQIPCALVLLAFSIGYVVNKQKDLGWRPLQRNLIIFAGFMLISALIVGIVVYQHQSVVATIQNTAYPGHRSIPSGGYSIEHLSSSNLSPVFQSTTKSSAYSRPLIGVTNQSESSNFILIFQFLMLPLLYLMYKRYRKNKQVDYIAISLAAILLLFMVWMFLPGIDIIGKLTLLDKVPQSRLLIGMGLLNIMFIVLFIKHFEEYKKQPFNIYMSIIYSLIVLVLYLLIDFHVAIQFPGFIGFKSAALLAIPIPIIIFLMLRRHFIAAAIAFTLFSFLSVYHINPLYRGTSVLTETPISLAIREIGQSSNKKWISEDIVLENFAAMNGQPSITGTYLYPQLSIWRGLNVQDKEDIYNRYAHVNFTFDRSPDQTIKPVVTLPGADQFNVRIEPCDEFLAKNNVGFLITSVEFAPNVALCADLIQKVIYPTVTFNIYRLHQ